MILLLLWLILISWRMCRRAGWSVQSLALHLHKHVFQTKLNCKQTTLNFTNKLTVNKQTSSCLALFWSPASEDLSRLPRPPLLLLLQPRLLLGWLRCLQLVVNIFIFIYLPIYHHLQGRQGVKQRIQLRCLVLSVMSCRVAQRCVVRRHVVSCCAVSCYVNVASVVNVKADASVNDTMHVKCLRLCWGVCHVMLWYATAGCGTVWYVLVCHGMLRYLVVYAM